MALVVRRAFTPKNLTLLRCFKGRSHHITTAAIKRDPAFLANVKPLRSFQSKQSSNEVLWNCAGRTRTPLKSGITRCGAPQKVRISISCPNFTAQHRTLPVLRRSFSTTTITSSLNTFLNSSKPFMQCRTSAFTHWSKRAVVPLNETSAISTRQQSSCSPCPSPCSTTACPANCLPPPCQTAPRCVQYMTGYYYYPYGWWFCGPYHNAACAPCGPCNPEALRCGACCVVPSAALATGASLTATDMTLDPSMFDKGQVQNSILQQKNQQTTTSHQQNSTMIQNPNAPTPLQSPVFIQENKSGVNKFLSFSPTQNPPPSSPKWPPLQQQPTMTATKKQPGNNNMSTLCNPKPVDDDQHSGVRLMKLTSRRPRIAPTRSQRLLQKQDSKSKIKHMVMSVIAATASEHKNAYRINKRKVYLSRDREYGKVVAPLQNYEYTAFTKRRVLPEIEPLRPFEP